MILLGIKEAFSEPCMISFGKGKALPSSLSLTSFSPPPLPRNSTFLFPSHWLGR